MAKVRVTGNIWDHSQDVIPEELEPRLWAVPIGDRIEGSVLIGIESLADLDPVSGAFGVDVEAALDYFLKMDWIKPGMETQPPAGRSRRFAEWPVFNSGGGGPITTLFPPTPSGKIVAELSPPPPGTRDIVWIDLTDVAPGGALTYASGGN